MEPKTDILETITPEPIREHDQIMAHTLMRHIEEGKGTVPEEHEPLVCKPQQIESWRVFKIMSEFVEGFEILKKFGLAATFFGTARDTFDTKVYNDTLELSGKLANAGYAVFTGGNNGVMKAANKGAYEAGGASIGLNINLKGAEINSYLTESITLDHFFVSKVMLAFASEVYIFLPGGFGTLDEFTEILTLVQTKKIKPVPIVLYGAEYWNPIVELFRTHLLGKYHAIDEGDMELFKVVDSVDEAFTYIQANVRC